MQSSTRHDSVIVEFKHLYQNLNSYIFINDHIKDEIKKEHLNVVIIYKTYFYKPMCNAGYPIWTGTFFDYTSSLRRCRIHCS